jgi:hypothetical protein
MLGDASISTIGDNPLQMAVEPRLQGFRNQLVDVPPVFVFNGTHRARAGANIGPSSHKRIVRKTRIDPRVGHFHQVIAKDRVRAESDIARRLGNLFESLIRHEPLQIGIDQTDQRDRLIADKRCCTGQGIEKRLSLGIKDVELLQSKETLKLFVGMACRIHHSSAFIVCTNVQRNAEYLGAISSCRPARRVDCLTVAGGTIPTASPTP